MPRSSNPQAVSQKAARPARHGCRVILGVLVGLNLIAAGFVLFPPGGSAEQMEEQLAALQSQVASRNKTSRSPVSTLRRLKRDARRAISSWGTIFWPVAPLIPRCWANWEMRLNNRRSKRAKSPTPPSPIEGSDTLSMMTITASYEGTYQDLMNFVHQVDQSPGLMIIESLNAAPQSGALTPIRWSV